MDTPRDKGPFPPEDLLLKAQECKDAQAVIAVTLHSKRPDAHKVRYGFISC